MRAPPSSESVTTPGHGDDDAGDDRGDGDDDDGADDAPTEDEGLLVGDDGPQRGLAHHRLPRLHSAEPQGSAAEPGGGREGEEEAEEEEEVQEEE